MPADLPKLHVVSVTRDSKFQISYKLSDGSASAFRVVPAMADFIVEAWAARRSSHVSLVTILEEIQELTEIVKGMS